MTVTVEERFESRQSTTGENASVELVYAIRGTDDDLVAKAELAGAAPSTYDGLIRLSRHIEPEGPQLWRGTVRYGKFRKEPPAVGESAFSFDTGGGSQHVTQSIQTVGSYAPAGKTAPDFQGAIGVTESEVEGVDITVPVYSFSETHYLGEATVTQAYKLTLFSLTGRTNDAAFKGFAAGEVLFLGASGSKRGDGAWEIAFRFAASPNRTGITVGPITGIAKKGWEYLWVRYADAEDATAKALVKQPVAAYVERVYEEGDFSLLGIGT